MVKWFCRMLRLWTPYLPIISVYIIGKIYLFYVMFLEWFSSQLQIDDEGFKYVSRVKLFVVCKH